jgi:group I intron endonuclease
MDYIYKITNTVNNKSYVGYTTNPQARWSDHKYGRGSKVVYQAIKKYGVNKFVFEVIAEDTVDNEQQYINKHNTMYPNGYNLTDGGSLPPNHKGKTYKEIYGNRWRERIEKFKKTQKERGGFHSMPHTEATKKKISQATKGKNNPMYGKQHRTSTIKKISENKKQWHKDNLNPNAKQFVITSPDGKTYTAHGNLGEMCEKLGLNFATVRKSHELNRPMRSGWRVKSL